MRLPTTRARIATSALAVALVALLTRMPQAAPDTEMRPDAPSPQTKNEVMVPIPGFSPEVKSNGCRPRQSPAEMTEARKAGRPEVPFWGLIEHATGRYAVHAGLESPEAFAARIAPLDDDMRRLVLLAALRSGLGYRDSLHTYFSMRGGAIAPMIRDALAEAGLVREHDLFARAMSFFGTPYPTDHDAREKLFGYSKPAGRRNAFDAALLAVDREFGSRDRFTDTVVAYVNRSPTLFARIEGLREKLGDNDRMSHLLDALSRKIDWEKSGPDIARQLAALPKEERNLLALSTFNMEFENGGVHQFFYNSSGDIAPEVLDAMIELGLAPQAEIFKRALALLGEPYIRDNTLRREARFKSEWTDWDKALSRLTDDFYAIGGGAKAYRIKGDLAFEGGPGFRHAMVTYARASKMLPC
jgi:hypothetical protein